MYPAGELKALAGRKSRLRARIERRRLACIVDGRRLVEPLEKIDLWRERLRQAGPYLPFGLALFSLWRSRASRAAPPPPKPRGGLLRWLPVVFQGYRAFQKMKGG